MAEHEIWAWLLTAAAGYLLGSVSGAIVASFTRHNEDIRRFGSGNAGLTNALRTYGVRNAAMVAGIDLGKTVLAVLFGLWLLGRPWGLILGGGAAALGHVFPLYYRFRGGKGILCGAALLLMLDWRVFLITAAVFAAAVAVSKTVSVGSVLACAAAPILCVLLREGKAETVFITLTAALLLWMHRENLRRIERGEEKPTVAAKRRPRRRQP